MKIIDTHCDALLKLWRDNSKSFFDDPELDTNSTRLKAGQVKVQIFAIWVPETVPHETKFRVVQEQINMFHERVLAVPEVVHMRTLSEIEHLKPHQIGAVLSLEGMDPVGTDLGKLDWLYEQGICAIGLTWNQANLCADGIGEERGAGLTAFGKHVIERNNQAKVVNDVSHLSLRAFWDVMELSTCTIASHSNAYTICDHDRNLRDDQIDALIENDSFIGMVFFPTFVKAESGATIDDLLRHFDYFSSRGGVRHIGFGSDFDGISKHVTQLEHAGMYDKLINELLKHYREEEVNGFCATNFIDKVVRHKMFQ